MHSDTKLVQYEEYIDRQVESTRRLVKIVDLATSLVVLAAGVLAYLLSVAVVEHWLVPGGFPLAVRAALFTVLIGGVAYFVYGRIWPLLIHAVNPVYAAQAIEQSGPTLKNSLVNLLLFRQRRNEISEAVYQTLEEHAAQRLSRVPVDAAVDRSLLIRVGYVLLAVVAVASLYKVLSPKDPLVAAQRVLLPWADIVPASRVSISDVEPGSVTVSRGEFLDVSAEVRGIGEDDPVLVRFTTDDGRAVNKPVPMKLSQDGLRFEARLPGAEDASGGVGLSQDLRYRIEAGDARSLAYDVTVVASPSILVERIEYDYPGYTGDVDRAVEGLGDISAIEGTRVTVHARANGSIREAHVDFDADGRRDLQMNAEDRRAQASFELRLRDDRLTPRHASYVLRFTNRDGRANRDPVKYAIDVVPDRDPEASILAPKEKELSVRLDETVAIDVEARDPDFALAEVRLHGEVGGRAVLDEPLLEGAHRGRFTTRYSLTPSGHDLRAGDVLEYWVTADDNRAPEPNSIATERKRLRIASPDPAQQPPPDRLAQNEPGQGQQEPQPGEQQPQDQGQPKEGGGGQQGQDGEQQPGAAGGEGQRDENQQPRNGQRDPEGGGDQALSRDAQRSEEPGQQDKERGREGERESAPGEGAAGDQPGESLDRQGDQSGQGERQQRPGESESSDTQRDKQTGAGAAGGDPSQGEPSQGTPSQEGAQPAGARPGGSRGERPANGQAQSGEQRGEPDSEPAPVSSDGDNDAEAFERIRRHLERDGQLPEENPQSPNDPSSRDAQRSEEQVPDGGRERQGEGEAGSKDGLAGDQRAADRQPDDGPIEERTDGSGADTKAGDQKDAQDRSAERQQEDKSPGGEQTSSKGPAGAGEEQPPQRAPNSQPELKPGEKREPPSSPGEETDASEPPAGSRGKKESDSQGEQGGDKAGGGEEGGGQKAPREGTGSAGQNQAADEGAGQSTEEGSGTDSSNAGRDAQAEKRTGESGGKAAGEGSRERGGEGQQPGGSESAGSDAERSAAQDDEQAQHEETETGRQGEGERGSEDDAARPPQNATDGANQPGTATGGGGLPGSTAGPPPRSEGTVPEGDEANLEYARKQTDLVLEKLSDQLNRQEVDEQLLDELGWSEEDLRQFVQRWQERKEAAQRKDTSGDAARRELDEALRSLGLGRGAIQQERLKQDSLRDLREGYRGPVPLEYRERLRAYSQGVSRAREEGE